jgi:hypothetical protein
MNAKSTFRTKFSIASASPLSVQTLVAVVTAMDIVEAQFKRDLDVMRAQATEIYHLRRELIEAKSDRTRSRSPCHSAILDLTNGKGQVKHVLYDLYNKKRLAERYVPTDAETEVEWQDRMMQEQYKEEQRLNEVFGGITVAQYVKESHDRDHFIASNAVDRAASSRSLRHH